jgi:hypothetical protein
MDRHRSAPACAFGLGASAAGSAWTVCGILGMASYYAQPYLVRRRMLDFFILGFFQYPLTRHSGAPRAHLFHFLFSQDQRSQATSDPYICDAPLLSLVVMGGRPMNNMWCSDCYLERIMSLTSTVPRAQGGGVPWAQRVFFTFLSRQPQSVYAIWCMLLLLLLCSFFGSSTLSPTSVGSPYYSD